jgi:hypothetical protein
MTQAVFTEITDHQTIMALQARMREIVSSKLKNKQKRTVGSPGGSFVSEAWFKGTGPNALWWSVGEHPESGDHVNLVGHGDATVKDALNIDLQFNFHRDRFTRGKGGVFLKDADGAYYLGHRGIATKGRTRLKKASLLNEAKVPLVTVTTEEGSRPRTMMLVAPLEDPSFVSAVGEFAAEVRRAANVIAPGGEPIDDPKSQKSGADRDPDRSDIEDEADTWLKDYFPEYQGKKRVLLKATAVVKDWKHGRVVAALQAMLATKGRHHKCREIDLAVIDGGDAHLFEVKTSCRTTDIYTGIGQLSLHGLALKKRYPRKRLTKYLVLAGDMSTARRRQFKEELGILVVSYRPTRDGFEFEGL